MKKTVEIVASFTGKISTGQFENESPFFSLKEVYEEDSVIVYSNETIIARQQELEKICYDQFKRHADLAYAEKISKQFKNIRFYELEGKKVPSVTSIIGWDQDFYVSPEELAQYGARGTIIDKQVEIFLTIGEWKLPKDIPEIYPELVILSQGNLGLSADDVDFRGFYLDYPFKVLECQKQVFNMQHSYAGRLDVLCIIESKNPGKWGKIEGVLFDVPTILDIKSSANLDKTKGLKQQCAYAKCLPEVKQIGLIPLTNENKCGFAKPILEQSKEKYWHLFLRDRQNFKQRFGI